MHIEKMLPQENASVNSPEVHKRISSALIPNWFVLTAALLSGFFLASPVFGTLSNAGSIAGTWSDLENLLFLTFARLAWGLGLGLMCLLCAFGRGYIVNTLLSAHVWTVLARLSFGAYLVHPIIMLVFNLNRQAQYYYTPWNFTMWFLCYLVLAYACAFVFYLLVEKPLANLEGLAFSRRR
eukprot:GFYU01014022.1.p3 GENE.GFYU01014022.1~~GFYU01014022.1.p3  ORF type:complete len:181 (+),score=49.39 GFYU01014022.1:346-888(+)